MKTISHLKMHADGMMKEEKENFITIFYQHMRAYQKKKKKVTKVIASYI